MYSEDSEVYDKIGQLSAAKLRERNQQTSFFFFFVRVKLDLPIGPQSVRTSVVSFGV